MAVQEEPRDTEGQAEDADGKGAGRSEGGPGEAEDKVFEGGPDGECDRRVEVALPVPVPEENLPNCAVAVPAFVGVL